MCSSWTSCSAKRDRAESLDLDHTSPSGRCPCCLPSSKEQQVLALFGTLLSMAPEFQAVVAQVAKSHQIEFGDPIYQGYTLEADLVKDLS